MTNCFDGIMNAAPDELYRVYQVTFGAFAEKMASKNRLTIIANGAVCTENRIRVDAVMESPKLAE